MAVDRQNFESAVISMKRYPNKIPIQNEYVDQIRQLTTMLFAHYRMPLEDFEDSMQDMMLQIFKKKLHEKINPEGDPLAFYWSTIKRDIWRMQKEKYKKKEILHKYDLFDSAISDDNKWELEMLKDLGFKLEDYDAVGENNVHMLPTIKTSKPQRGRPKTKKKGAFAKHWEDLFALLKENKQLTEKQMLNKLPTNKLSSLLNPTKSIKYYMKNISNREGYKLTTTESGSEIIYILVGA